MEAIFLPLGDHQLFDDSQSWALPDEEEEEEDNVGTEGNSDNAKGKMEVEAQ